MEFVSNGLFDEEEGEQQVLLDGGDDGLVQMEVGGASVGVVQETEIVMEDVRTLKRHASEDVLLPSLDEQRGGERSYASKAGFQEVGQSGHAMGGLNGLAPKRSRNSHTDHSYDSMTLPLPTFRASTFAGHSLYLPRRKKLAPTRVHLSDEDAITLETPVHRMIQIAESSLASCSYSSEKASSFVRPGKDTVKSVSPTNITHALWVDKYRPKKFVELLGDEKVNRQVMAYIKEWDHCVFKRKPPKRKHVEHASSLDQDRLTTDLYNRPTQRLLLISGPPGLGKTTLAHVAATHAGYDIMEINASDDRNRAAVNDRIRSALESQSLTTNKPTLLIIDEIDGATGGGGESSSGFINTLIKLIAQGDTAALPGTSRSRSKKQHQRAILRPIICICNDLYAPALRPLRSIARLIRLTNPSKPFLIRRLKSICDTEDYLVDTRSLSTLVSTSGNDIRTCLNTLQFLKANNQSFSDTALDAMTSTSKDKSTSLITIWNRLFRPLSKSEQQKTGTSQERDRYVNRLAEMLHSNGEYDRVAQGCFQHYAKCRPTDLIWNRFDQALDSLALADHLSSLMYHSHEFGIAQYLPYCLIRFYPSFNSVTNPDVEYPRADHENFMRWQTNNDIGKSFTDCFSPRMRASFGRHAALMELAPLLMRVITPNLSSSGRQATSDSDRAIIANATELMMSLNIQIHLDKNEAGQIIHRYDPPIDVFTVFEDKCAADIGSSRFPIRQILAAEIAGRIAARGKDAVNLSDTKAVATTEKPILQHVSKEKIALDFFGRPLITLSKPSVLISSAEENKENHSIPEKQATSSPFCATYRYHDGSSTAVRRPVHILDFL